MQMLVSYETDAHSTSAGALWQAQDSFAVQMPSLACRPSVALRGALQVHSVVLSDMQLPERGCRRW